MLHKLLRLSWRNLHRQRLLSATAALAVTLGCAGMCIFDAYLRHAEMRFTEAFRERGMLGDILVHNRVCGPADTGCVRTLSETQQAALDAVLQRHADSVALSVPSLTVVGLVSRGRNPLVFQAIGYDVPRGRALRGANWEWNVTHGVPLHATSEAQPILLAHGLADLLACPDAERPDRVAHGRTVASFACEGQRLQLTASSESGRINALQATAVGISNTGVRDLDAQAVFMPLALAQQLADTHGISGMSIALRTLAARAPLLAELNAALPPQTGWQAIPWQDSPQGALFRQGMSVLGIFRSFVAVIVAALACLSVMTTVFTGIALRRQEIGTQRALGFLPWHVQAMFCAEAGMLAGLGAVVGAVFSTSVCRGLNAAEIFYRIGMIDEPVLLELPLSAAAWLQTVTVLAAVAVGTAWLASRGATRLGISQAMEPG